jgi:hypothetical protein
LIFCFFCIKTKERQEFFTLLFSRKKVAKSSVLGLRYGAPLLKTDRFGDPTLRHGGGAGFLTVAQLSVRCASTLNMHQRQSRSEFLIFPRTLSPPQRTERRIEV